MTFEWTKHRFSGGALALDVANSVVMRHDRERRIDRFADRANLSLFPVAAANHCAETNLAARLLPVKLENESHFIRLREAIDVFYRASVLGQQDLAMQAELLEAIAGTFRRHADDANRYPLDLATAKSALGLMCEPAGERLKICGNCGWLFIDRSRNRSRAWCDMAVCGNRVKARLFYEKKKGNQI